MPLLYITEYVMVLGQRQFLCYVIPVAALFPAGQVDHEVVSMTPFTRP